MTDAALRPSLLPSLELEAPSSIEELTALVARGFTPIGGGSDVLLAAAHTGSPSRLAYTGHVPEFSALEVDATEVTIGAAVTLGRLVRADEARSAVAAITDGAQQIGSAQLRNTATVIGNLCTASPAGDTLPGQFVHRAQVDFVDSAGSRRSVPVADFATGPGSTSLDADEIVIAVRVEACGPNEGSAYRRFTERNAIDLAFAGVAARVAFEEDEQTVRSLHLALGAVGPTVVDASREGAALLGGPLTAERVAEVAATAAASCSPISDHRCSADFRRQLIRVLTIEAIDDAASRARERQGRP
ncbi:MAG: hypothetical protein GY929_16475 [Actinomycetia bacterium]|nr:hypothetical protein [Actinomycetes bacterium]